MLTCLAGSSAPALGVPFLHTSCGWVAACTPQPCCCRAGAVLCCSHPASGNVHHDCLSSDFLHTWTQLSMIQINDVRKWELETILWDKLWSSQRRRVQDKLCCVHGSLVAEVKYAQTQAVAWQQSVTTWEERKTWVAEITSGLGGSDKTCCWELSRLFLFLLSVLSRRNSFRHVSILLDNKDKLYLKVGVIGGS